MVEIFAYTERVVNMVRPRKLLFMAIGKSYILLDTYTRYLCSARRCRTASEDEPATLQAIPRITGGKREGDSSSGKLEALGTYV